MELQPALYRPLSTGTDEIRLLHFLPSDESGNIHGNLETFPLENPPKYCALSYEWGSEGLSDHSCPFFINLAPYYPNRKNLRLALLRLYSLSRSVQGTMYFWIDAICINQGDITERNHQVRLMRQIYKKAGAVVVDLGEDERETCKKGLELIQQSVRYSDYQSRVSFVQWAKNKLQDPDYLPGWKRFLDILRKSYWGRRWVIQELLAGTLGFVFCGFQVAHICQLFDIILALDEQLGDQDISLSNSEIAICARSIGRQVFKIITTMRSLSSFRATFKRSFSYLLSLTFYLSSRCITMLYVLIQKT
jgi:hypothetical protein